jgi:predicted amidohydrolase
MPCRIAIAQIAMHWTTRENVNAMKRAISLASSHGAHICAFSELAVSGFHRQIAQEAKPEVAGPAVAELRAHCALLSIAASVGAPTFSDDGKRFISQLLIDERGELAAAVAKQGLTAPEAIFFERGTSRPIGTLQGLRCSAVICREIEDNDQYTRELPRGSVDLVFVPGALRQDPEKPRTDPPEYVRNLQRLALATGAHVVQTNWPNALNRPQESVDGGESTVAGPDGLVRFRLPRQAAGVGIFTLGEDHFEWRAEPAPDPLIDS